MVQLSVVTGFAFTVLLFLLGEVLPRIFRSDAVVLAQCRALWPVCALLQPINGAVFALDGILIGASDGPFIAASMILAFACCATALLVVLVQDRGIVGVWVALGLLVVVRLVTMAARFRRRRWLVTGFA
jgi:Na+-driven multidrug efflux pump